MVAERSRPASMRARRSGSASVELLFVFPLLLVVLLATVEFSLWLNAQQQVTLAAREGARVAATGGSADDINQIIQVVLGNGLFQQATVQSQLTDASNNPIAPGQPVLVLVQLPAGVAVPDLLVFVGLSIRNEPIISQTVMRKE